MTTDGAGNWVAVWDSADTLGGAIGTDSDILVARSTDAPGRFRVTRAFAKSGTYVLRVLPPSGDASFEVNFEAHEPSQP